MSNRMSKIVMAVVGVLAVVLVGVIVAVMAAGDNAGDDYSGSRAEPSAVVAEKTVLSRARESCNLARSAIGDHEHTLTFNTRGKWTRGVSEEVAACVFAATGMPDYVVSEMTRTRALDGVQSATWDAIEASWTYHPDDGLNVVLTEQ
jgi:hypothetical protein